MVRFPTHYYDQIPYMTLRELIDLIEELLRVRLDGMPAVVESAADELESGIEQAQARLDMLGDGYDPAAEHRELEFEKQTDKLAGLVRICVGQASLFMDLQTMLEEDTELDPEQQREREQERELAEQSRRLLQGLFGEDELEYFRTSYTERGRALAAMMRTLSRSDLGVDLNEVVQEPLRSRVDVLSSGHDEKFRVYMRERDAATSLSEPRRVLRFAIAHYIFEVGQTADRWSKDSCDRVNSAIWPLVDCCRRMASKH